jgi:hypothetical protein
MTSPATAHKSPALRILLICDGDTFSAVPALPHCHQLAQALADIGQHPIVLQHWPQAATQGDARTRERLQERPYTVYRCRNVRDDVALLALVEQPTLAITLGPNPFALAKPLLQANVPCVAWLLDAHNLHTLPSGPLPRGLGVAAATQALAALASAMVGSPVSTLAPPAEPLGVPLGSGNAVLVPSTRRVDGMQRVMELARARPEQGFVALAPPEQLGIEQRTWAQTLPNLTVVENNRAARNGFRCALLPALSADLPWDLLARSLASGLPVLGSTEPLLAHAVGGAGLLLPATAPVEAWLSALDQLLAQPPQRYAQSAIEQARQIRLPAEEAAQQTVQLALRHFQDDGLAIA